MKDPKFPMQNSLSVKVLKRYLSEEELENLINEYAKHKLTKTSSNRLQSFSLPLTEDDKSLIKDYLLTSESIKTIAKRYELTVSGAYSRVKSISFRLLSQHPDFLEKI